MNQVAYRFLQEVIRRSQELEAPAPAVIDIQTGQPRPEKRLTSGFSKKVENHGASVALYFMHYNFCRIHKTLRVTPAMEAGLTDHVWTIEEMLNVINLK